MSRTSYTLSTMPPGKLHALAPRLLKAICDQAAEQARRASTVAVHLEAISGMSDSRLRRHLAGVFTLHCCSDVQALRHYALSIMAIVANMYFGSVVPLSDMVWESVKESVEFGAGSKVGRREWRRLFRKIEKTPESRRTHQLENEFNELERRIEMNQVRAKRKAAKVSVRSRREKACQNSAKVERIYHELEGSGEYSSGKRSKQIAERLGMKVRTVQHHVKQLGLGRNKQK